MAGNDMNKGGKKKHRRFAGFLRNRDGSTAIEFGALAIPFCLLVFAILESCISFAAQQMLINATDDVSREIRTGQLRKADLTDGKMETMICDKIAILMASGCKGRLVIDLRNFATFEDAAKVKLKANDGIDIPENSVVDPGPSLSKNMLRVFYRWPVITDFMRKAMSNLGDGNTLLFATATWQNEPFDD